MEMGEKIYNLRVQKGLTLEELGNMVGVGKSTVRKWENGMIANMKRDKILKVSEALDTTPAYLMGWEDKEPLKEESSPKILQYYELLNDIGRYEAEKRVEELTYIPQYTLDLKAAHDDHINEPGELEKMREDMSKLIKPDSKK